MGSKVKNKNIYFTSETEDAILAYNRTNNSIERSKLYANHIHYPFYKLTQNIIHTFNFYNTDVDDLEHLQHNIIVYLLDRIHLYHHSKSIDDRIYRIIVKEYKGVWDRNSFIQFTNNADKITQQQIDDFIKNINLSQVDPSIKEECYHKLSKLTPPKAYSYFGTITKRFLIKYTEDIYNSKLNSSQAEDYSSDIKLSYEIDKHTDINEDFYVFLEEYIKYVGENLYKIFPKKNDAKIADSILELFRKIDRIDIFHKKALYMDIREILAQYHNIEIKTPKITQISDTLKEIFINNYTQYLDTGVKTFKH